MIDLKSPASVAIRGYASIFAKPDLSGDRVMRGAFAASLLTLGGRPLPMLFGHETVEPIGIWDRVFEDGRGLFVSGRIFTGNARADRIARLVTQGALSGLSIGYRVRRNRARTPTGRDLLELDLWEVSIVGLPYAARCAAHCYAITLHRSLTPEGNRMSDIIETKMQSKTALRDFSQTFEAFKDANDERLAQIEAKSSADALTTAKVDRINAALDDQAKRIERLSITASQPNLGGASPVNLEAKSAWSSYIRCGDAGALKSLEGKSIGTTDGEGGYIAPVEAESMIDRALEQSSPFRSIATVRRVGAGQFKKPISPGGASAGWAGETDTRLETTAPQLDLLEFPAGELYAMPAATQMLLDDGVADVDQWLADEVRDVFSAQETAAFINGDGINKPRGILEYGQAANGSQSWGEIGTVSTGVDGGFDEEAPNDALLDLVYAPETRYRTDASFVMNRRTVGAIRKFKDADGNYIWQPSTEAGTPSTLLGYRLTEVEDMPDIASGSTPIAFGDFRRGYLIVDRQGVRVLRDPYSAKPYVLFYTTKRVGGGVQDFNAIKLLKFAA